MLVKKVASFSSRAIIVRWLNGHMNSWLGKTYGLPLVMRAVACIFLFLFASDSFASTLYILTILVGNSFAEIQYFVSPANLDLHTLLSNQASFLMRFGMGGNLPELRPFYWRIEGLGIDLFFFWVSSGGSLRERWIYTKALGL